jgi:hypothetical protein
MALLEKIAQKINLRKKIPSIEAPKTFPTTILRAVEKDSHGIEYETGLPFDIEVSNNGSTLTRKGDKFEDELGIRIFIIDNLSLNKLYSALRGKNNVPPEIFYKFLKMYERKNGSKGRYLALSSDGVVELDNDRYKNGYTIIIKDVDHPTKEKYETPDRARLEFKPGEGFTERIVERTISWFKEKSLDLTAATKDVEVLSIKERYEQPGMRDFLRIGGEKDDSITAHFEKADRENGLFIPNRNTVIIKSLRENMGSSQAQSINADIRQDSSGNLLLKITKMSGVDGISLNGLMYSLEENEGTIEIPLIDACSKCSNVRLYYNSRSETRRLGLEMNLRREKDHIIADFVSGIAEVPPLPFDPTGGFGIAHLSEREKAIAAQRAEIEKNKKKAAEVLKMQNEIGHNFRLFTYVERVDGNISHCAASYQKGDEERLHSMVEELKKKAR